MRKGLLKLYVTGKAPSSRRAMASLRRLCDEEFEGQYRLVIIDVMEQPQLFPLVRDELKLQLNDYIDPPELVPPALGNRAGILGAMALAQL